MIPSGDQGGREGVVAVIGPERRQNPAAAVARPPPSLTGSDDLHAPDPESGDAAAEPQISDSRRRPCPPPATPASTPSPNPRLRPPRALWQAIEELVGLRPIEPTSCLLWAWLCPRLQPSQLRLAVSNGSPTEPSPRKHDGRFLIIRNAIPMMTQRGRRYAAWGRIQDRSSTVRTGSRPPGARL
jgi:hypothetical protein